MRMLIFVLLTVLSSCKSDEPMPEYAAAMKLYQDTMASTLDPTHMHGDFANVAAALRAVPKRNKSEHARAQHLAEDIERAQAERAAVLAKAAAPLPESAFVPPPSGSPAFEPPPPPPPPPPQAAPTAAAREQEMKKLADCVKEVKERSGSCIRGCDAGCAINDDGSFRCTTTSTEQQLKIAKCVRECQSQQAPCKL